MGELCSDDAAVAVWAGDFAPDDADLGALSFAGGAVDEGYFLAQVESEVVVSRPLCSISILANSYCASFELSTPSILSRDVLGLVFRFPRWYDRCLPLTYTIVLCQCCDGPAGGRALTSVTSLDSHFECVCEVLGVVCVEIDVTVVRSLPS